MKSIVGIFQTRSDAETAVDGIVRVGIPRQDISLLIPGTAPAWLVRGPAPRCRENGRLNRCALARAA